MNAADLPRFALSIRQPWAWAILHAGKRIENRSWHTRFRGAVCIHAASGCTKDEFQEARAFIAGVNGAEPPPLPEMDRGGIVGVALLAECVHRSDSPWFFGPFGFVLTDVRPVTFIPVKGALGFFDWRDRVVEPAPPSAPDLFMGAK